MNGKRIFIISDSYTARVLLYKLNYLLDANIDSIFLLKENHSPNENYFGLNVELVGAKQLKEHIDKSDIILGYANQTMPAQIFNSLENNNRFFLLSELTDTDQYNKNTPVIEYSKKPVILNIAIGEYSASLCTEILINEILTRHGAIINQSFLPKTFSIIESLERKGLLNKKIHSTNKTCDGIFNVIVKSIYIDKVSDMSANSPILDVFENIQPNFCIVTTTIDNPMPKDTIKNILMYRYNISVDFFIQSPFITAPNKKFPILCNNDDSEISLNLSPEKIGVILEADMLAHIAYPDNMCII